jgi:hypothetical protein
MLDDVVMSILGRPELVCFACLAACGGSSPHPAAGVATRPEPLAIALVPTVADQAWYRSLSTCAQGPYELELVADGGRWEEDLELRVTTPRRVAINAVMLVDGVEVGRTANVFDAHGAAGGTPENSRCVADARERLQLGRTGTGGGGGGATGTPGTPGIRVTDEPPQQPKAPPSLQLDETGSATLSVEVLKFRLRDRPAPGARIKIKFWSIEPNDLEGVLFGALRIAWRPNVPEAEYDAYLVRLAAEEQDRLQRARLQAEEDERLRLEAWRREQAARPPRAQVTVRVDAEAELAAYRKREDDRRRREQHEADAATKRAADELEAERRRVVAEALEAERRARRAAYCARSPEDRGCWGAGGLKVHLDLEARVKERADYCARQREDARCWDQNEWSRRRTAWDARVQVALTPAKPPEGPPPEPLAEVVPPKLSLHADWRPGYWQWTEGTWVWLAGMWRVPEADIVAEQTTTAPAPPPPPQVETAPVAPVRSAVWIGGFWQWNATSWVWIPGSWQLRPEARVTWRVPEWRPRGKVHVLIPGGWIRIGGR